MPEQQPTKGVEGVDLASWRAHPWLAHAVRILVLVAPPLVGGVVAWALGPVFWRPAGLIGAAVWVFQLGTVGMSGTFITERLLSRLLPLVELLRMTLVFPDQAPSRYSVALRTGTIKQQQAVLESVREHGFSDDDQVAFDQLVTLLAALGRHERLTRGHTERVRAYTDLIGEEMGLSLADRQKLHWAALLHDIGKLAVPSELLSLDGRPTDEQWRIIKQHPAHGAKMVDRFADWLGEWRFAAGDHHERWDGGGYPRGLSGTEISLAGRIVAVADAFDVMTSARSYKKATPGDAARVELVRCSGAQFDPAVVRAFLRISTGDLRAAGGRLSWLPSATAVVQRAGQGIALPLTAAAGVVGLPVLAATAGLADELGPLDFSVPTAAVLELDESANPRSQDPVPTASPEPGAPGDEGAGDGRDPQDGDGDGDASDPGSGEDPEVQTGDDPGTIPDDGTIVDGGGIGLHVPTPTVVPTVPPLDLPDIDLPDIDLPDIDLPGDLPDIDLPGLELPDLDLPDLPGVELPDVPLPDLDVPDVVVPDLPVPVPTLPVPVPTVKIQVPTVKVPVPTPKPIEIPLLGSPDPTPTPATSPPPGPTPTPTPAPVLGLPKLPGL